MRSKIVITVICLICSMNVCLADPIANVLDGYFGNNTGLYNVSFSDIDVTDWAKESIMYLAGYGIVSGYEGRFFPNNNITREQFVKILILAFGLYDEDAECNYTDVQKDSWCYKYIASAAKLGIVSGISRTHFGVGELVTREQMITLVYNACQYSGIIFEKNINNTFTDENEISDYAKEAVYILSESGIISGDDQNSLYPRDYATRAEACKLIYSVIKKIL